MLKQAHFVRQMTCHRFSRGTRCKRAQLDIFSVLHKSKIIAGRTVAPVDSEVAICAHRLIGRTNLITHRHFHTQTLLHIRRFYTQSFWRHRHFYTAFVRHRSFYTQTSYYTRRLLQAKVFDDQTVITHETLLHRDAFTHSF